MKKSFLFHSDRYVELQTRIRDLLNAQSDFLSLRTVRSTRAAGDAIQEIIAEHFPGLIGPDNISTYSADFARRAMADLAFEDRNGLYYRIDVKTHRLSTRFNMPNLTSVERLARFYEDDRNYFVVLFVAYELSEYRIEARDVKFVPIEFLAWDCLTIGALGWGQVQIANSNRIAIKHGHSRRSWMLEMCDNLDEFYPREIAKISERMKYFERIRGFWQSQPD